VTGSQSTRFDNTSKRTVGALERDEWQRAAWKVMVSGTLDARSLVYRRSDAALHRQLYQYALCLESFFDKPHLLTHLCSARLLRSKLFFIL
jgi:hypothetical protein